MVSKRRPGRAYRWAVLGIAAFSTMCAHDALPANVTPSSSPSLATLAPASGPVGTTVAVTGGGFTRSANSVKFGRGYINGLESSDGLTLRFTVPEGLNLCPPAMNQTAPAPCPGAYPRVTPGPYAISIMNLNGTSTTLAFVVTAQ